jgi:serine/threonine protein kinase
MDTSIFGQADQSSDEPSSYNTTDHDYVRAVAQLPAGASIHGKYTVRGVLGQGGFAVVYDAEHEGLGRAVAIKVLHIGPDTPLALVERFRREARISALVHHPNVLEVYDTGKLADGSPYLVMERVNGDNLSTLIQKGPLPIATTVEIGRQMMLGLSAIADSGIVHRDVKPANVMLHDAGDGTPIVKLVDFGISKHVSVEPHARLTCHGALVGTPQYMSPEQIRGEDVDTRSDLYAAGAVLYEALTGHAPHESQSFSELVVAVLNNQVRPLRELRANCPPELENIVTTALSRSRVARYPSPRHMLEALEEFACLFDLPRGVDAFRTRDPELPLHSSAARSSTPGNRRLWSYGARELKRPMQLTLIALLVGLPKLVSMYGTPDAQTAETTAPGQQLAAQQATTESGAESAAMGALAATLMDTPAQVPQAPAPLLVAPPVEAPWAQAEPTAKRDEPAATPRVQRRAHVARSELATPPSWKSKVAAAPAAEPAKALAMPSDWGAKSTLDQTQRAAWEQAMQQALAALVRGRLATARDSYAEAVRLAPREAAGFRGLGLVSARLGQNAEARRALQRYLTLSPHAGDAEAIGDRLRELPN